MIDYDSFIKISSYLTENGVALLVAEDFEGRRDPTVRFFTNHPGDALAFFATGPEPSILLVPWDINVANQYVKHDEGINIKIVPYTDFERNPYKALKGAIDILHIQPGSRIEIPPTTSYPSFLRYVDAFPDYDILCREDGSFSILQQRRAIKLYSEVTIYRKAAAITNEVIDALEQEIRNNKFETEADVALFIERQARLRGCEGTGFETLVAGPTRSFGIHAFPAYTGAAFTGPGLSIIDFGLKYEGYTTDVTITVARGPLNRTQERMLTLVEKAYHLAVSLVKYKAATKDVAEAVDKFFEKAKKKMPHALGHGIGLEAHEAPVIRNRSDNDWVFKNGMVFTLEPGLYDPVHGGCRLENDFILVEDDLEQLTNARIIRIDE
ncbi:Xaa-Pro peptidase family protein [Gracilinema caldarium]|uniref:M24 family metallopeptidase n=1 Tax=Gracilinema caldarium TaxID=215591 RepID=UPI0026F1E9E7|nr:Xaa-Pro peptidase family protein [Gracilinema caldarium]